MSLVTQTSPCEVCPEESRQRVIFNPGGGGCVDFRSYCKEGFLWNSIISFYSFQFVMNAKGLVSFAGMKDFSFKCVRLVISLWRTF